MMPPDAASASSGLRASTAAPLRQLCRTSLPHIKVDQRFGKRGAPHTAVAQFVVAPVVVNYRPRHFHELTPGGLMEFHYDFALVLKQLSTANCISIGYGPEWKPFQLPYCFVSCRDYRAEVLALCPEEIPNSRSEAVYEDDVVKDITSVILAVEELDALRSMSFIQAMHRRVNLAPLYDVFEGVFQPIGNYQIQIRDLHAAPSLFLLKTSTQILGKLPGGGTQIVLHGDASLWQELPLVDNTFQSGRSVAATKTPPPEAAKAPVAARGGSAPLPPKNSPQSTPQPHPQAAGAIAPQASRAPLKRTIEESTGFGIAALALFTAACVIGTTAIVWRLRR